ncbi:MAG TPA: inositol monophosphatase family protein [Chloroflexota bacterium]|nr:inositol monophosphatase family protein [Chloroflexota bacterium]
MTGDELAVAGEIAREAAALVISYFDSDRLDARAKGERDLVTAADTASEALIVRRLREAFPGDGIVAEEGGDEPSTTHRVWYVDPVDGTLNYARGVPLFSLSLSLFDGPVPVLGVVYDPMRQELFAARTGDGATLNGKRIRTSGVENLDQALVHMTVDFHEESLWAGIRDIADVAPAVLRTRNIGSAALALAYVAAGRFDAMIHRYASPWDYGAGVLLVQEAGGVASALGGPAYSVEDRAVLAAATGRLHHGLTRLIDATAHVE